MIRRAVSRPVPRKNSRRLPPPRRPVLVAVVALGVVVGAALPGVARAQRCADTDDSGAVTVSDGVRILRAAAGLDGVCPPAACDVDGIGDVSVSDGVNALRAAAELPNACTTPGTIRAVVGRARLSVWGELTKTREGRFRAGSPPDAAAGAAETLTIRSGSENAFPNRTIPFGLQYDLGTPGSEPGAADLIVRARDDTGTILPGFYEIPLSASASTAEIADLTLAPDLASAFTLELGTRHDGVVGPFAAFGELRKSPALNGVLEFRNFLAYGSGKLASLDAIQSAALSPDGRHLYSGTNYGLATFGRDATSGDLTVVEVQDVDGAGAVVVSPDGAHVYTSPGFAETGIRVFGRDAGTGRLTLQGLQASSGTDVGVPVAITHDGRQLFAIGRDDSGAPILFALERNPATGALTATGRGIVVAENFNGVAISPDDATIYVLAGAPPGFGIFIYGRNTETGALRTVDEVPVDVVPTAIAVSPDGHHVYLGGQGDLGVATLFAYERAPSGTLSFLESYTDRTNGIDGLGNVRDLAVDAAGAHVYATTIVGNFAGTVAVFDRDATTGRLQFTQAMLDGVSGVTGLPNPAAIALPADGAHLYVAAEAAPRITTPIAISPPLPVAPELRGGLATFAIH